MSAPVRHDDTRQRLQAGLAEWQEELARGLPPDWLAALALVPMWTEQLAAAAEVPLSRKEALQAFLTDSEKRKLCVRGPKEDERAWNSRQARVLMLLWRWMRRPARERWATRILEEVRQVPWELERLQYLIALSPMAVQRLKDEIRSGIQSWPDEDVRARLWLAWAVETQGRFGFSEAWTAASLMPPGEERARAQITLYGVAAGNSGGATESEAAPAPAGPDTDALFLAVQSSITAIDDEEAQANALLALARASGGGEAAAMAAAEAVSHLARISDPEERAFGLASAFNSLNSLPAGQRDIVSELALRSTSEIAGPVARARALFAIPAGAFDDERARLALGTFDELMASLDEGPQRDRTLALLVDVVARDSIVEADRVRDNIQDPAAKLDALAALTAADAERKLSSGDIGGEVSALLERTGRYELCGDFIPYLTPGLSALPDLVEWIEKNVPDPRRCREALLNIAAHAPAEFARPILEKVLRAAGMLVEERDLLEAFAQIAPRLHDEPMDDLMDKACNIVFEMRPDRTFTMPDPMRQQVLEYLSKRTDVGAPVLQKTLVELGRRINGVAEASKVAVPLPTSRWTRVAALCDRPLDASALLAREIGKLVDSGELGAAIEWYTTGERIAAVAGTQLREATLSGRRRVEVASRRIMDARHLARYVHREEQGAAFQALLADPKHWALHYLGMGGAGKTMLLRHIVARLAMRDGVRLAVGRVDFDEMSPEFPVRQPGTLLLGLAEDLRRFLPPGTDDRFTKLRDDIIELHGALTHDLSPENPLESIRSEDFDRVLGKFAALLSALPKPVVLILDTCEELAKLEPWGRSIPAVDATFEILERLHARTDVDIRVVFAGRRLLAQKGHKRDSQWGWQVREGTLAARTSLLPDGKDYLSLHVVRGFTDTDVERYLKVVGLSLDTERRTAILNRSKDLGAPADIDFAGDDPSTTAPVLYNPFDISLYVDWVQADASVTAEVLGSGEKDPYVEMRIIRRVGELAKVIPGAVLLRRFDEEMLRPVLDEDDEQASRHFRDLAAQEWIDVREGFFQVDANLLERLEEYYAKHDARALEDANGALAPELARLAQQHLDRDAPFDAGTTPLMDAALRLLPSDEAAGLWDKFERRLTQVQNWAAAQRVCEFLLGPRAAGADQSPLRAPVMATLIATRLHTSRDYDPGNDWVEVAQHLDLYPNGSRREWLAARVLVGRVLMARAGQSRTPDAGLNYFQRGSLDNWQIDQFRGAVCAFLEHTSEVAPAAIQTEAVQRLAEEAMAWTPQDPELRMFIQALMGRDIAWSQVGADITTAQRWLDWRAPASIRDRSRLMDVLRRGTIDDAEGRFEALAEEIATIDADRLASQLLALRLQEHPVPPDTLKGVEPSAVYDPRRVPVSAVHRAVPPLFHSLGMAMIANGDGAGALALSSEVRDRAQQAQDPASAEAAEMLRLRVVRRFRLNGAMNALNRLLETQHPNASPWHHRWATAYASTADEARALLDFAAADRAEGSPDPHIALDLIEADQLAARIGDARRFGGNDSGTVPSSDDIALAVRRSILRNDLPALDVNRRHLLAADRVLEEGELLGLRLPGLAARVLKGAQFLYGGRSPAGELIAAASAAIAALKAGDETGARAQFSSIERPYGVLRSIGDELPAWEELSPAALRRFRSSIWYGWLLRLTLIKAHLAEPAGGPQTQELQPLIARFLADDGHPDFSLQAFEAITVEAPAAAPRVSALARARSIGLKVWRVLKIAIPVAVLVGIFALEVYGLYRGAEWVWNNPWRYPILAVAALSTVAVIMAVRVGLPWLARALLRRGAIRMDIVRGEDSRTVAMTLQQQFGSDNPLRILLRLSNGTSEERYSVPESGPSGLQPKLFEALATMRRRLPMRPIVPLYVDDSLAREPWEAILDLPLERKGRRLDERVAFIRAAAPTQREPRLVTDVVAIVAGADVAIETVARGWRATVRLDPPFSDPPPVMQIIGRPRRSRSGPVFVLSTGGKSVPVSHRDLHANGAALLVVQEEPVERLNRLDVDREQTADARAWAAEAFGAGADAVILVPAMPAILAAVVVQALADGLRTKRAAEKALVEHGEPMFTPWQLADAVTHARHQLVWSRIPKAIEGQADLRGDLDDAAVRAAVNELALDITLFARSEYFSRRNPLTGFPST